MTDINVGDEARVFYWRTRLHAENPDGFPGTVIKVAKKYGTIRLEDGSEIRFDLGTGFESPDTFGRRVRTLAQIEQDERRNEAVSCIGLAGLEFKVGRQHFLTLEQLEQLAEVIKTWDRGHW
jgi:hypothetical protein